MMLLCVRVITLTLVPSIPSLMVFTNWRLYLSYILVFWNFLIILKYESYIKLLLWTLLLYVYLVPNILWFDDGHTPLRIMYKKSHIVIPHFFHSLPPKDPWSTGLPKLLTFGKSKFSQLLDGLAANMHNIQIFTWA